MERHTTSTKKPVFAGIDYHKKFSVVTLGDKSGKVILQETLVNNEKIVKDFFTKHKKLVCAVESCRGYEWFVSLLEELGHEIKMGDSRSIKLIAVSRCKTDRIDSLILMEMLAKGYLTCAYQPNWKERDYRQLLRHRVQMVRTSTKHKLRVHAILDKENRGVTYPFTGKGREVLKEIVLSERGRELLDDELEIIDFLEEKIAEQYKKISFLARQNPDVGRLKKIPGFDTLSAMMLFAEVGDITRFRNADQLASYTGLVPRVYSSGGSTRTGRITKQGPKLLRWILVQSAWAAIKASPNLHRFFTTISRKKSQKVAIVAVARKLATIAFHVLKEKAIFDESKLDAGLARAAF